MLIKTSVPLHAGTYRACVPVLQGCHARLIKTSVPLSSASVNSPSGKGFARSSASMLPPLLLL